MNEAFVIERGIPIPPIDRPPPHREGRRYREVLRQLAMEPVGSSAFFPDTKLHYVASRGPALGLTRANSTWRTVEGGVRVWRIA